MKSSIANTEGKILVSWEQKDNKAYFIIYNIESGFETGFRAFDECEWSGCRHFGMPGVRYARSLAQLAVCNPIALCE